MAHVFPHLARCSLADLEAAFYGPAEELTPYLQAQVNRRPPGQRGHLEALARSWHPLNVGDLAQRSFSSHKTTSSQLRQLVADRLVTAMKNPDGLAAALVRFVQARRPAGTCARRASNPSRRWRCWPCSRRCRRLPVPCPSTYT